MLDGLRNLFGSQPEKTEAEKIEIERATLREETSSRRRHIADMEAKFDGIVDARAKSGFGERNGFKDYPTDMQGRVAAESDNLRAEIENMRRYSDDEEARFDEIVEARTKGHKTYSERNHRGPYAKK